MRTYPECVPCLINQGLNAVKKLNLPKELEMEIAIRALKFLSRYEKLDKPPAYYAYFVQKIVKELTGLEDPFRELKKLANEKALALYPSLEESLKRVKDPLLYALKVSAVGNALDFAIKGLFNLEEEVKTLLKKDFFIKDYEPFKEKLASSQRVFIIGDNAGEIVFDKLFVSYLKKAGLEVYYGVKGKPILNDVTYEDAEEVSMTKLCKVVDNGSDKVGTWLEDCSEEFRKLFYEADLVIAKGQANFETLSDVERELFFLLVAKCEPIAKELKGKRKELILRYKDG